MPVANRVIAIAQAKPVVAVNHGDSDQGAESHQQNPRPFNPADSRFADNNTLASRIQRLFERSQHLRLSDSLAIIGRL